MTLVKQAEKWPLKSNQMQFKSINKSAQMYVNKHSKVLKVKTHYYLAHRVNESLLVTVYSIAIMMAVKSDAMFIQTKSSY